MPIIIKDIEWQETENILTIKIPSRGVPPIKIDIFSSKYYIKASYEQYFFEAFLLYEIDPNRSTCTILGNYIIFELIKCEPFLWNRLEIDVDKAEKQRLKKLYIEEEHKRFQEECTQKKNQKYELKRVAVREQIALDTKEREEIAKVKQEEKTNALKDIETWHDSSKPVIEKKATKLKHKNRIISKVQEIEVEQPKKSDYKIPEIRQNQTIYVELTPRIFPTPCRESKLEEENDWLRKQAEARRTVGFVSDDLRPEERNPQFLKEKGDEFMKNENYLGAISAYTFGISLNKNFVDLYVARSAAHFSQGNYKKTAEDCSTALELMKPEVPANLQERALCIGRRGISLLKLGIRRQGIGELEASLKLLPNREYTDELNNAYALDSDSD